MSERKLTELEVEKRCERAHPASVIARLFCASMSKRLRYGRAGWLQFNAISMKYSPIPEFVIGAQIGAFVIGTARKLLEGNGDERMDVALREPDWSSIEAAARVLLEPGSRFLNAPVVDPVQDAPHAERRGLAHVPSGPRGAGTRHHASRVMRV